MKLFLWLLLGLLPTHLAAAACMVNSRTSVSVETAGGTLTVPLDVNGIAATFVLDTGAERSVVTQQAVQRLGLTRDQWVGTTMQGLGGIDRRANADPYSFSLGGVALTRRTLNHDISLAVGFLPGVHPENRMIDGLLGRDFLSSFDLDLDIPDHRLTLYQVSDCTGRFLPWTASYTSIPVIMEAEDAVILPAALDNKPLRAMLDTGASASLLAASGIYRLGLEPGSFAGDLTEQISGLGPRLITVHRHRFHTLRVGNQIINSPELWVEPVHTTPFVDMLLGADWLATRRVWISYATRQLFMAENQPSLPPRDQPKDPH